MSFKFNFYAEEDTKDADMTENLNISELSVSEKENSSCSVNAANSAELASAEHLVTNTQLADNAEWLSVTLSLESDTADKVEHDLYYLKNATFGGIASLISTTDLIPNVYEGGFQVWECTIDLLHYLTLYSVSRDTRVLDLGCGAGLLGILACKLGQEVTCHFQDFNADVIKNFTIPNYVKNCTTLSSVSSQCKFLSGDWSAVSSRFTQYELILSSETIYNVTSQAKILSILTQCLSTEGVALIASKRHYFGVGGGVLDFIQLVEGSDSGLVSKVVWSSSQSDTRTGLARDIIMITRS